MTIHLKLLAIYGWKIFLLSLLDTIFSAVSAFYNERVYFVFIKNIFKKYLNMINTNLKNSPIMLPSMLLPSDADAGGRSSERLVVLGAFYAICNSNSKTEV